MSQVWYYVDASGQQVGPMSIDELRASIRRGSATLATLAWRDGMAAWTPISQLTEELGIDTVAPAGAPPPLDGTAAAGTSNPYRAPDAMPELVFRDRAGEVVYAGFWRRFAARVLDHFVVFIPMYILAMVIFGGVAAFASPEPDSAAPIVALMGVYVLPIFANFFYFTLMESSSWQATLGKMALGIKVTDAEGRRLTFGQAAMRWFAAALSYFTIYIGFIMAGFTEQKRALHDMLASTLVVDKWAYTKSPERQQQGMSGCLIVFIVFFVGGLFVVPILAAIAISQYQDYVIRSQVSEGVSLADGMKTAVGEYTINQGSLPTSNAQTGLAAPASIVGSYVSYSQVGPTPGRIEIGYSSTGGQKANNMLEGKHLLFDANVSDGSIQWTCHSEDLKQKWCPSSCQCSG